MDDDKIIRLLEEQGIPSVDIQEFYRAQGYNQALAWIANIIETELLWKNQDEGFIYGLKWALGHIQKRKFND